MGPNLVSLAMMFAICFGNAADASAAPEVHEEIHKSMDVEAPWDRCFADAPQPPPPPPPPPKPETCVKKKHPIIRAVLAPARFVWGKLSSAEGIVNNWGNNHAGTITVLTGLGSLGLNATVGATAGGRRL